MKMNRALDFIARCINEMEADGYQTWEHTNGEVPDGLTPDDHYFDNGDLIIEFEDEWYRVKAIRMGRDK